MQKFLDRTAFRGMLWRLGRKLYCKARREVVNQPDRNGEWWILERVLQTSSGEDKRVFLDIGANVGEWTAHALRLAARARKPCAIHAFEPASATHALLEERFAGIGHVHVHRLALSDEAGERSFFVVEDCAGTNSLYTSGRYAKQETVRTLSLDQLVAERNIREICMVKSDTEGHDFKVLLGARDTLGAGRIRVWQFEYNWRWVLARHFLKDVFDFARGLPYAVGKLYGAGIEVFDDWHPELERFFEGNYVLIRRGDVLHALCRHLSLDDRNNAPSSVRATRKDTGGR